MAMSIACGPCAVNAKSTPAEYWCHECDNLLCEECFIHHSTAKTSEEHTVISVENYRKLPESVRKVSLICKDHGFKYSHFCPIHDAPCCPACAQSIHTSCPNLQLMVDVTRTAKTSSFINEIETIMKDIQSNLENILSERDQNVLGLRKQKQQIKEKISTIRKQVNQHIDELEIKIKNEISRLEEIEIQKLQQSMSDLTASLDLTKNKLEETTMLKQYASDLHTFLGTRELYKMIENEKTRLEKLFKEGTFNIRELQCDINDKIQAITSDITTFGSISVISKPSSVRLTSGKDKQAQIILSTPHSNRIKVENATAHLKSKFNISGSRKICLRGCSLFPNNRVVIADSGNNRVIILTESGSTYTVEKEIPIRGGDGGPYEVTVIDNRSIAVSTNKGVQIINLDTGTVDKKFDVEWCYGLSYDDGLLYCCVCNTGVMSIEMSTRRRKRIIPDSHSPFSCPAIHVDGGYLYYTRSDEKGLKCFSITGEKKWEYVDPTQINYPVGVTADGSGNTYLASSDNHQILIISPDGKRCRPILSGNDGIQDPFGLCYNKNKNELYVVCFSGQCFHYKIN